MERTITKVIGGKRYSTETAEYICGGPNEYRGTFRYEDTSLFRTPRGRFFLSGYGGPMSRWAEKVQGGRSGGEGLEPISAEEARDFAEAHASPSTVAQYFDIEEA